MSTKCMMSRMRRQGYAPAALLGLALLGAGCKSESERAADAVRDQAKDVREQAGKVKEERRELGNEVRELHQTERDAWTQWARSNGYQVEFNPDGSVAATKSQPPTGTPPPDETLRQAVTTKLGSSDHPALKNISVTSKGGVVTLRGSVPTIKEATDAADQALKTEGVTRVVAYLNHRS